MRTLDTPTPLHVEQLRIQSNKKHRRTLADYDREIFPFEESEVADFLGTLAAGASSTTELLHTLSEAPRDKPLQWVDMAGGLGVALREASVLRMQGVIGETTLTNVDLFDWSRTFGNTWRLREISTYNGWGAGSDLSSADHAPELIIANAEEVSLSKPADLITCVQAVQYFNNPLRALTNWYNQLDDEGLMIVTRRKATWSADIKQGENKDTEVLTGLFEQFDRHGIRYAADQPSRTHADGDTYREGIDALAIQKYAGTSLRLNASVINVWVVDHEGVPYKNVVQYDDAQPAVEVVMA